MVKRIIGGMAAAIAVVLALTLGATPATAAASDCAPGLACIWSGPAWTGTRWTFSVSQLGINRCNILGTAWHQDASWKVDFGSGLLLGVYVGTNGCQTGIVGGWGPNRLGNLSPTLDGGPSGSYKNVGAIIVE